jgi:hypothetical protein
MPRKVGSNIVDACEAVLVCGRITQNNAAWIAREEA